MLYSRTGERAWTSEATVKRILLAEDERPLARLVQVNLERAGYQVEWVSHGAAALQAVAQAAPDVIILDVAMPEVDGFEVLRHLKADPETADIPVIMLTGRTDEESVYRSWAGGVHYYMTKPFDPRELALVVERVFDEDSDWQA
ncbi:MAG: response regulator [Armatimonadetes bacterium]|nr:response regulator [Armatimonadota bacterium]